LGSFDDNVDEEVDGAVDGAVEIRVQAIDRRWPAYRDCPGRMLRSRVK